MSGKKGVSWSVVTQEDFDKVKALTTYGLSIKQIAEVVGKSKATISRIREATDFTNYKLKIIETRKKYAGFTKTEQAKANEQVEVPASTTDAEMLKLLQNVNDVLVQVNSRLQFVEEHVEVVPKRRIFG